MDGGAWQAIVYRVAQSWICLRGFHVNPQCLTGAQRSTLFELNDLSPLIVKTPVIQLTKQQRAVQELHNIS